MHTLRTQDRDRSMTALVSFHHVPMPRGIAFVIRDIETDGAPVEIFSADRTMDAIGEHNRQFGTKLSGQAALLAAFRAGRGNPANPPDRTSHCYRADTTVAAVLNSIDNGVERLSAGARLPWWGRSALTSPTAGRSRTSAGSWRPPGDSGTRSGNRTRPDRSAITSSSCAPRSRYLSGATRSPARHD